MSRSEAGPPEAGSTQSLKHCSSDSEPNDGRSPGVRTMSQLVRLTAGGGQHAEPGALFERQRAERRAQPRSEDNVHS